MRRPLLLLCCCFLLAACAGERGGGAGAPPVTTSFAADAADTIEVMVTAERPVESAELAAPDGRVYPAYQILRDRVVEERGGGFLPSLGIGVGVFGGSSTRVGTNVGVGFPLGGIGGGGSEAEVTSRARIRVEDMEAYRAGWQDWTVRLQLGKSETGLRLMEVPAPPPPPAG